LTGNQSPRRISLVMRFAKVKAEAAGRGTRSKAHRPADSLSLDRTALIAAQNTDLLGQIQPAQGDGS
jgi:hypothetical protein